MAYDVRQRNEDRRQATYLLGLASDSLDEATTKVSLSPGVQIGRASREMDSLALGAESDSHRLIQEAMNGPSAAAYGLASEVGQSLAAVQSGLDTSVAAMAGRAGGLIQSVADEYEPVALAVARSGADTQALLRSLLDIDPVKLVDLQERADAERMRRMKERMKLEAQRVETWQSRSLP